MEQQLTSFAATELYTKAAVIKFVGKKKQYQNLLLKAQLQTEIDITVDDDANI